MQQPVAPAAPIDETALLTSSAVFDQAWYELEAGRSFSGLEEAVAHYRKEGAAMQFSPHPLFDPTTADETARRKDPARRLPHAAEAAAGVLPTPDGTWTPIFAASPMRRGTTTVRSGILRSGSPTRRSWTSTGWPVRPRCAGVTPRLGGMWR